MIHITPEQYDFILRVFDDETFGGTDDLRQKNGDPVDFEVIGCGLDASLEVSARAYQSDHGTDVFIYLRQSADLCRRRTPGGQQFQAKHIHRQVQASIIG